MNVKEAWNIIHLFKCGWTHSQIMSLEKARLELGYPSLISGGIKENDIRTV